MFSSENFALYRYEQDRMVRELELRRRIEERAAEDRDRGAAERPAPAGALAPGRMSAARRRPLSWPWPRRA